MERSRDNNKVRSEVEPVNLPGDATCNLCSVFQKSKDKTHHKDEPQTRVCKEIGESVTGSQLACKGMIPAESFF